MWNGLSSSCCLLRCFAAVFKKSAVSQPSILFFYMIYFVSIFDLFSTISFVSIHCFLFYNLFRKFLWFIFFKSEVSWVPFCLFHLFKLITWFSNVIPVVRSPWYFMYFWCTFNHFAQSILILSYPAMAWSCKISQISQMCKKFMVLGAKFGGKQVMIGKVSYMF